MRSQYRAVKMGMETALRDRNSVDFFAFWFRPRFDCCAGAAPFTPEKAHWAFDEARPRLQMRARPLNKRVILSLRLRHIRQLFKNPPMGALVFSGVFSRH
jgi:hypothetical protein